MLHFSRRQSLLLALCLVVTAAALGRGCYQRGLQDAAQRGLGAFVAQDPLHEEPPEAEREIIVHLCGEVHRPGVYRMKPGARVAEAIKLAGGETAGGDRHALQLAQPVRDGDRIDVPSREETRLQREAELARLRAAARPAPARAPAARPPDPAAPPADLRVSINRASMEEWDRLPGIGPVTARAIIEHREAHGRFTRLEALMEVRGIGEKTFERLRPYLTLE